MKTSSLNRLSEIFYLFSKKSGKEEIPKDSEDLKTILSNISELETYKARKDYAESNLERLSSGSSRIAYLTPNKRAVIKLAKNDKGIAQNTQECKASEQFKDSKFLNKVLGKAPNFSWVMLPYVDKITEKQFQGLTDIDFKDFDEAIRFALKSSAGDSSSSSEKKVAGETKKPKNYDDISDSPFFREIKKIGKTLDLIPGDLAKISSYGRIDDHPILIDAGLTRKIFRDFYESS